MLTTVLLLQLALSQGDTAPITALRTTRPMRLYASPGGNDGRTCRLQSAPCRSPNTAARRIPHGVDHQVVVVVGAGVYDGGLAEVADHEFGAADALNPGQIIFECEQRTAVLDGGSASGTITTAANGSGATWATYTDTSQSWAPSAMVDGGTPSAGYWLALTSGPGSDGGMRLPIIDNSATVLQVPGQFTVAPSTATGYTLQEPAAVITGTLPLPSISPGPEPGSSLRPMRGAQLVVRNNRGGYDPTLTTGAPDGGAWAPVVVRGCYFRGDASATMAGVALDGALAFVENRVTGFGSNGRFFLPTSSRAQLVVQRSSFATPLSRVLTFTAAGAEITRSLVEQNVVSATDYFYFGSIFSGRHLSHNNLFQTISSAVWRGTVWADASSFGDQVQHTASVLRVPGGSDAFAGHGQFNFDGLTASDVTGSAFTLASAGGLSVSVDKGNATYGNAASSITIASGGRLLSGAGAGLEFTWRNGTTVITESGASPTLPTSLSFTDTPSGFSIAQVNASQPHMFCTYRGSCAGWGNDTTPPFGPIIAWAPAGTVGQQWAVEPVDTVLSSGTMDVTFSHPFFDTPFCGFNVSGGTSAAGEANVAYTASDGGVTITGPTSARIRGTCSGPR